MKFRLVQPGEFLMGSPAERVTDDGSQPQHAVRITKPYYVGVYEVTQDEFTKIMEMTPSHFCATGVGASQVTNLETGSFPVDRVTWEEAVEFCGRLSDLDAEIEANRLYRLPTEAEWEYACRGGTSTPYAFGAQISPAQANFTGSLEESDVTLGRTAAVGSYEPNAFGLYDMHGNVWEWCAAGKREYSGSRQTDPQAEPAFYCMLRGGAWDYPAEYCRSDYRREALAGYVYFGFRVVCEVPE